MTTIERKKILIVNRQAPYGNSEAQETLDVLLMLSTFDQELSVLFLDDGVWQLKAEQDAAGINIKNFAATYRALPLYDIKNVYVAAESLQDRGLTTADLMLTVTLLTHEQVSELLIQQQCILNG